VRWFVEPPSGPSVCDLMQLITTASCRSRVPAFGHQESLATGFFLATQLALPTPSVTKC